MIKFQLYTATELTEIRHYRAHQAFREGTVETQVIDRIAEQIADTGGDCWKAFTPPYLFKLGSMQKEKILLE